MEENNFTCQMYKIAVFFVIFVAVVSAFVAPAATRPARMTMLFNFGKKAKTSTYEVGKGTANKGEYIPDGISSEQYTATLKAQADKSAKMKAKFFKGKNVESLTEWMEKEAKKGNSGKNLLLKGHRMVKAKYDGWFTNESPV